MLDFQREFIKENTGIIEAILYDMEESEKQKEAIKIIKEFNNIIDKIEIVEFINKNLKEIESPILGL